MTTEELKAIENLTSALKEIDASLTALISLKIYEEAEHNSFKIPIVMNKIAESSSMINEFLKGFKPKD